MRAAVLVACALGLAACTPTGRADAVRVATPTVAQVAHALIERATTLDRDTQCLALNWLRARYPAGVRVFLLELGTDRLVCPVRPAPQAACLAAAMRDG